MKTICAYRKGKGVRSSVPLAQIRRLLTSQWPRARWRKNGRMKTRDLTITFTRTMSRPSHFDRSILRNEDVKSRYQRTTEVIYGVRKIQNRTHITPSTFLYLQEVHTASLSTSGYSVRPWIFIAAPLLFWAHAEQSVNNPRGRRKSADGETIRYEREIRSAPASDER